MSAAAEIARLASAYPPPGPRQSLDAVVALRRSLALGPAPPALAVVGTNGKTSTATYLARLLTAAGRRTGLYVSPHLSEWGERVRIDDVPSESARLLAALRAVHESAQVGGRAGGELRFFDILTLAAELTFARAGASVAVYEAGIGGRLDAVRTLEPRLTLLTNVAIDHAELLGETPEEILTEKLLVAPAGGTVLSRHLGVELDARAEELAGEAGFALSWVEDGDDAVDDVAGAPAYLRVARHLAEAGAAAMGAPAGVIDLGLPGRFERGEHRGVPYVLDVAHNEAAWLELAAELRRRASEAEGMPMVALVSVSPGKRRERLAEALRSVPGLREAIVTSHTARPAAEPREIAAELRAGGLEAGVAEPAAEAAELAFARAREAGGRVLVCGSSHLVGELRPRLGGRRRR